MKMKLFLISKKRSQDTLKIRSQNNLCYFMGFNLITLKHLVNTKYLIMRLLIFGSKTVNSVCLVNFTFLCQRSFYLIRWIQNQLNPLKQYFSPHSQKNTFLKRSREVISKVETIKNIWTLKDFLI
jgi:hypothetical protein